MSRLLRNAIRTPDGTVLESRSVHDYKEYEDANGWVYIVDGGLEYLRRSVNKNAPAEDLSVAEGDHPHSSLRDIATWGTYGKAGDEALRYIKISEMTTGHLTACLRSQDRMYPQTRELMEAELKYRE